MAIWITLIQFILAVHAVASLTRFFLLNN